ncbi:hypothetical protein FOA43_004069 [Brettanomyces nanus]|uniref:RING-type domain-containing protein n=1 Tax=Eeniella nana TaxID=13502 RepID=A0A875S930_EENNA|nr:uncharacterized protein FOA43_004069 [Brettanomyces nanus]QPG76675.1 hypothetical protein FOA43_004069 [Brettanomyces nanus]
MSQIHAYVKSESIDFVRLTRYLSDVIDKKHSKYKKASRRFNSDPSKNYADFIRLVSGNIVIANSQLCCSDGRSVFAPLEQSLEELATTRIDIIMKFSKDDNGSFSIWSYPSGARGKEGKSFCLFVLDIGPESMPILLAQHGLFKPKFRHKRSLLVDRPHLTDLHIAVDSNDILTLGFNIQYQIDFKQSLDEFNSVDFIRYFTELSNFIMITDLTSYQKACNKNDQSERRMNLKPTEADFYSLITENTEKTAYDKERGPMSVPGIHKKLMGFQSQTLEWMLHHEGVELELVTSVDDRSKPKFEVCRVKSRLMSEAIDDETLSLQLDAYCFGWSRVRLLYDQENYYWFNMYTCNLCSRQYAIDTLKNVSQYRAPAQALLSEEMGLGKTVEVLSMIQMNPRPQTADFDVKKIDTFSGERYLSECKTTLIICPQTIIGQWLSEIREGSDLNVMIYEGISSYEREAQKANLKLKPEDIAKKLSAYDIVLVSYHTVSLELHRAVFMPTRRPKRRCTKKLKISIPGVTYDFNGKEHVEGSIEESSFEMTEASRQDDSSNIETDNEYERIDYSSPLMLLEFWRVVLDEVQMTASMNTNASKFARIIPRVHAWGVSGTLIKTGLEDLYSLLRFLRYSPIDRFASNSMESPWRNMTEDAPYYVFSRLFKSICLRHTKKMVADQIKLPKQSRIMLRAPFTSIERDNYDFLFGQFLTQVGLNENGEPSVEEYDPSRSYSCMRKWLIKLRQVCCHAQMGRAVYSKRREIEGSKGGSNDHGLVPGTLDEVLGDLIKAAHEKFCTDDRAIYALELKKGKIYEFLRRPEDSLKLFENVIPKIEGKAKEFEESSKKDDISRLRSWRELLHQAYFMLASSYYQHYRPMKPLPSTFAELNAMDAVDDEEKRIEIDTDLLSDEEKRYYNMENEYYNKADALLMHILEEPLKKVDECIEKMVEKFEKYRVYTIPVKQLPEELRNQFTECKSMDSAAAIKLVCKMNDEMLSENHSFNPQTSIFYSRAKRSLTQLNLQAHIINNWITRLVQLLQEPVTVDQKVDQLTGEEYGKTLVSQELADTYLEVLQTMLEDREHGIVSLEEIPSYRKKSISTKTRKKDDENAVVVNKTASRELFLKLDRIRKMYMPDGCFNSKYSLKLIWLESTNIEMDMRVTHGYSSAELLDVMHATSQSLKEEFDNQKKNIAQLRTKVFEVINDAFNARVNYFRALQIKSDSLVAYRPEDSFQPSGEPAYFALKAIDSIDESLRLLQNNLVRGRGRLRYLKSLEEGGGVEADSICVICRSQILVGVWTECGHKYCKDCLEEWMKNKPICPICKRILRKRDLYTFTCTQKQLKGGLVEDLEEKKEDNGMTEEKEDISGEIERLNNSKRMEKDIFKIYRSMDNDMLREIMSIQLAQSYGSKIDMILRQVLFLKKYEKGVQILVFSQWPEFLKLLGHAMVQNDILFLSSVEMSREMRSSAGRRGGKKKYLKGSGQIELFKTNPEFTCFLLNAKAQAAGLTLTNASHVFLCEPLVNLSLELQAISRVHRIGQMKPTTVWNFVIENTVEESIAYLSTKRRLELSRERSAQEIDVVDEDALGVTELSKNLDNLLDKNDGEVISNDDLWTSFFANKSVRIVDSIIGMHAKM